MSTRLYVGNLGFGTAEEQVRHAFSEFGKVLSVSIITDRVTGQSRGFGFVEYESTEDAESAIGSMNGAMLDGRALTVNVARERSGGGSENGRRERPARNGRW